MSPEKSSVKHWVKQLRAGDTGQPVQKLWERYFQRLVTLARAMLGSQPRGAADEEDVALSAFGSFCNGVLRGRFPQLEERDNLWRLLVTITARKVYRLHLRHACRKRGGKVVILEESALTVAGRAGRALGLEQFLASEPTPEFAAEAADEYQRLLGLLPNEELRAVAQWKMQGFTNEEIAARLDCVPRSVERRLRTIRICWERVDCKKGV
jgi:DNA-directed RNA polymerase specialized sigma24 family protein